MVTASIAILYIYVNVEGAMMKQAAKNEPDVIPVPLNL